MKGFWLLLPAALLAILALTIVAFGLPLGESMTLLFEGALADKFGIHRTILKSAPLIMVALGTIIAWRAGMFNIGGEGQLIFGVCTGGSIAALCASLPASVQTPLILVACGVGGAGYAGIAGWLYAARGVNVVISTILLNFVAVHFLSYLVRGPLQTASGTIPQSEPLEKSVRFAVIDGQTALHAGVILVPIAAVLTWIWLMRSTYGFKIRLVGQNPNAARAARLPVGRIQVVSLMVSGALCGLAGGIEYLGSNGILFDDFSPGWGFMGIPVALLAGLHPIGAIASGLYFGALFAGSKNLEAFGSTGSALVFAMQGAAVLAFAALSRFAVKHREAQA
ncbi:MAG: ABC transporter permease [Armatimonadota bacterium]|nr:ABC transporter permease [Armatimonadota bacterium]